MPSTRHPARALFLFALAGLLPVLALWLRVPVSLRAWVAGGVTAASLLTFIAFWQDKRRAEQKRWRTPESTLLLSALLGGWLGALLALHFLRHKSAKRSFQWRLWGIIAVHEYVALDWLLHWQIARWLTGAIGL